jgi:hypothetical protein
MTAELGVSSAFVGPLAVTNIKQNSASLDIVNLVLDRIRKLAGNCISLGFFLSMLVEEELVPDLGPFILRDYPSPMEESPIFPLLFFHLLRYLLL